MAKIGKSLMGSVRIDPKPKKSRQGDGKNTKHSATSRNRARKKYRGQGN